MIVSWSDIIFYILVGLNFLSQLFLSFRSGKILTTVSKNSSVPSVGLNENQLRLLTEFISSFKEVE